MKRAPRIFADGICHACKEHTQIGFPCCGSPVEFEGGSMTRETAYEADCDDGLVCGCSECSERFSSGDAPCRFDCEVKDVEPCDGCQEEAEMRAEQEYDWRKATGRL